MNANICMPQNIDKSELTLLIQSSKNQVKQRERMCRRCY